MLRLFNLRSLFYGKMSTSPVLRLTIQLQDMASSNDGMDAVTLRLTAVALAVSIVAIVLSTLQAFLAYLQFNNSEVSKRTCSGEVMGELWAKRTERKFNWGQFRYLVFFEVPVFYTAPPE